jgi:cysteine desulfurase
MDQRSWFCLYSKNSGLQPLFFVGTRKGLRAGTEALHQIAGMAKALELSYANLEVEQNHITELKNLIIQLKTEFPDFKINGTRRFYTVLNVLLPFAPAKQRCYCFI